VETDNRPQFWCLGLGIHPILVRNTADMLKCFESPDIAFLSALFGLFLLAVFVAKYVVLDVGGPSKDHGEHCCCPPHGIRDTDCSHVLPILTIITPPLATFE